MRYAFASLGKLESLGVRLGEAGLGNRLFPWDTAFKKFWLLIEREIDYDDPLPISVIQLLNND